jgi:DNA-binding transcriptional LysR family regulator
MIPMTPFDWNDLKYLLAVARHHSTTAAARALQVNQSTVQRRLVELERCVGQALVERRPSGYRLTAFGTQLLPLAEQVEQAATTLGQHIAAFQCELTGTVRMTCPEPLVYRLSNSTLLERFRARYPGLQVEFVMSDQYLDFGQGDIDIALRSGDTTDNSLVGRKVGDSLWAVYASPKYLAQHGTPQTVADLAQHDWISFDTSMAQHRACQWLLQVAPYARLVARNNSVLGLVSAARAGVGLAALPTALGDAEPELVRVLGPIPELARIWRVLTTPELRHTPRVAALFDFLVEETEALRPIVTG